jgi:phosphatidylinositol alpha-1,6-mannosyltransferase
MNVLFVSLLTYDNVGGIETFNKYFIKGLKENDIQTKVISYHDMNSFDNVIGCKSNIFLFVKELLRETFRADVIIWGHINLLPIFLLLKYAFRRQHLLIVHGVEVWYQLPLLKRKILSKIDRILSVSQFTRNKLLELNELSPSNVIVFPNCIELNVQVNTISPYNKDKFNILTILRLDNSDKLKSIINILDAMKLLSDNDIHFTIVGKGNRYDYIQDEIKKRGLEAYVSLLGFVETTSSYLEHCNLFSLISDREGFGIVYLEAMEYSKPCFSASGCGSEDVVLDGHNGYSFKMDDVNAISTRISQLKGERGLAVRLGRNGNDVLSSKYTFERFKKNQKLILDDIGKSI